MFKRVNFKLLRSPALFLFLASVACSLIFGYNMYIVTILIQEFFAFLFAVGIAILGGGKTLIWINYIVAFLMLNTGAIASAVGAV